MAEIANIQEYGNQLVIVYSDGAKKLAYPTANGVYLISSPGEEPPPPPPPGDGKFVWPFPLNQVTSEYGPRNGRLHAGIDFGRGSSNVQGTPVPASGAGKVVIANTTNSHGGYGNAVVIDHGGGRHTLYGHLHHGTVAVSVGQTVAKGQKVGGIGQTGASQGLHLHFETHEGGYRWNASSRNPRLMLPKWNA